MVKVIFQGTFKNGIVILEAQKAEFETIYTLRMIDQDGQEHTISTADSGVLDMLSDFIKQNI